MLLNILKYYLLIGMIVMLALGAHTYIFNWKRHPNRDLGVLYFVPAVLVWVLFWLPLLGLYCLAKLMTRNDPDVFVFTNDRDERLAVLRSHPDEPDALPRKYEGRWMPCPFVPARSLSDLLDDMDPPRHADWETSVPPQYEDYASRKAVVVYVRQGIRPSTEYLGLTPERDNDPFNFGSGLRNKPSTTTPQGEQP